MLLQIQPVSFLSIHLVCSSWNSGKSYVKKENNLRTFQREEDYIRMRLTDSGHNEPIEYKMTTPIGC